MSKIFCPLLGVSFKTHLIIMTLVDAICSLRDWSPPFDWAARIDRIWKTTISRKKINGNYDQYIKIVLSWVTVCRMAIAHFYTITHAANLCTILTWGHEKVLLPWLMLGAFKNFFLESIVIIVVIFLYVEENISGFLFMSIMIDKFILLAVAAHNWLKINSFYVELEKKRLRESNLIYRISNTSLSPNVMLGMSMQNTRSGDSDIMDQFIYKLNNCWSLPNLNFLDIDFVSRTELHDGSFELNSNLSTSMHDKINAQYVDDNDNSELRSNKNSIGVLKSALQDIDEDSKPVKPEINTKTLDDSISIIERIEFKIDGDEVYKSVSCDCRIPDNLAVEVKVVSDKISLTVDSQSEMNDVRKNMKNIGNSHSKWVNQWSLKQLMKCPRSQSFEKDGGASDLIFKDYVSRWSSNEDLNFNENSIGDLNNKNGVDNSEENFTAYFLPEILFAQMKNIDYYKQLAESWMEYLKSIENSFEITLQSYLKNNSSKINNDFKVKKSWDLDDVNIDFIENEDKYPSNNQSTSKEFELNSSMQMDFEKSTKVKTDNNKPLYKSSMTQTSLHELTPKALKYSYYKSLSMHNSSNKKCYKYETAYEREKRELKALIAYNARTLWKDKNNKDIEKFVMHDRRSNALNKTQSLKSNNENQLYKRKQRHQSKNISRAKKVLENSKINSVSCKKIQVTQVGQHLNRIKARENIHSRYVCKILSETTVGDYITAEYCSNKLKPTANSQPIPIARNEFTIKNQIAQLDWTLSPGEPYIYYDTLLNKCSFDAESGLFDVIDGNDTVDLLQSAFSFDIHSTGRGFYIGPASIDLYSVSEQIPNVFHEIVKGARVQSFLIDHSDSSKVEIDFGDSYYQELINIGNNNKLIKTVNYTDNPQLLNNSEIFAINCWIEKLEKLSSDCGRNDRDLLKFVQLIQAPEFFILRRLINNLSSLPMISASTITSRPSITAAQLATTSNVIKNNE